MPHVVPLPLARDPSRFGGKCAALSRLSDVAGVRVPAGFAIDAAAMEVALVAVPRAQWPGRVVKGGAAGRSPQRLEAIRRRVQETPLPDALLDEVLSAWRAMGSPAVAVRSSGLHEDGVAASAAGLQESVLGVSDGEGLARAVARCWASLWGERAVDYLSRLAGAEEPRMAVLVQALVDAEVAGVIFTADPVTRDADVALVEATWGLGSSVVDGAAVPDVFRVDRATGRARSQRVADKRVAARFVDGAVRTVEVEPARREAPSLDARRLAALMAAARAVEAQEAAPRDIEFAFAGEDLWILQARPITGLAPRAAGAERGSAGDRATWVWSNVNVGEALPGVATPLTWSIGSAFSELGFRKAFEALGCRVTPDMELVGNFHGRIYLNLTHFMRVARQVPALNARMLLEFGGGGGLDEIERQVEPGRWGPFLLRLPVTATKLLAEDVALPSALDRFERDFARSRERLASLRLASLSSLELRSLFAELRGVLDRTGAVMLTCASGYLGSVVLLRSALRVAVPEQLDRFEHELLAGFSDLESAAPGVALVHIAEIARGEPAARAMIEERDPANLRVDALPSGPTRRAFEHFMRAYGFRCVREAELSTPRWREAPGTLFAAVRAHLLRGDDPTLARIERQIATRAAAERALEASAPPVARAALRHLLGRTQRFARLRERMRARVTESLGFLRTVALEAGRRIADRVPGEDADAAFYLTADELDALLGGALIEPGPLLKTRRAQVARDLARPDPPAVFVGAPPPVAPPTLVEGDRFHGVAAAPGVVTGRVRVLRDPSDGASLLPGEVMVTPVADVGLTPLFLVAAAVVTELGGALSHASLVAREYGVPAVVNVVGATRSLRTGDRVRVDGDRGVVERVTVCEAAAESAVEAR
ncbi:MAG: PEP/pyruvate-binding domain-containing protein [Polyangiales bacterium]